MNKKALITAIIVTIFYALITLNTVLHHEVWADEAQVWQICKHLSLSELFNHLKNEGHPILFYLLVMPFAKIFPDAIFMKLICWFFMSASVFLLMYFSPFKLYTNIAIILSAGFLYFFPVLARNYSIIPFLIFLAAILYKKQKEHPVLYATNIALLTNTHIIMFFLSICLSAQFFYETIILNKQVEQEKEIKKYIFPLTIILIGFLTTILILCHTTGSNVFISIDISNIIDATKKVLSLFFLNSFNFNLDLEKIYPNSLTEIVLFLTLVITYILMFINLFLNNKKLFYIALSSIGFQLLIYIFAYNAFVYVNRIFCAHIILLLCFWILLEKDEFKSTIAIFNKKGSNILLSILFAITIFNGIKYTILDIKYEYSGSRQTAEFIKNNIEKENSLILIDQEQYMIAIAYYLNGINNLHSVLREKDLKFVVWDEKNRLIFANQAWLDYSKYYKQTDKRDFYVIRTFFNNSHQLDKIFPNDFELVYETKNTIEIYEGHRIYKYIGDKKAS